MASGGNCDYLLFPRPGVHTHFKNASSFSTWALRALQANTGSQWTVRGLMHAWPTQCVCPDPGPHCTPDDAIRDLAWQMGRSVRALLEAINDGGPEERATWPPAMPIPPSRPAHLPPPASLRVVENLHGAEIDIAMFEARAAEIGHESLQSSMRAAYLSMVADSTFSGDIEGLGTLAVPAVDPGNSHFDNGAVEARAKILFIGDPALACIERAGKASELLGPVSSETIRRSLERWPRSYVFGDDDGATPKRMNVFWLWSTEVLSACADRTVTSFGVRCAKRRAVQT